MFEGGVKELLVISQDTSAYGVDVKYRTGFWDGKPVKTRMLELVQTLGEIAEPYGAWVRLHYVYPYPSVDEVLPLMATGKVLPYLDVPLQHSHPDVLKRMKRPASGEKNLERIARWREICPEIVIRSTFIAGFPGETEGEFEHLLDFMREAQNRPRGLLCLQRGCRVQPPTKFRACCHWKCAKSGAHVSWPWPKRSRARSCSSVWAPPCRCWWTQRPALGKRAAWAVSMLMRPRSMVW